MKAIATNLHLGGGTSGAATVVLRPCWLARLFGARDVTVDLVRGGTGWRTMNTDRKLEEVKHGELIRDALDFHPRRELPPARIA